MLISVAHAASAAAAEQPGTLEVYLWNIGFVVAFVLLFYVLMVMPQQKRFKEHKAMLDSLKKGDKVVTGGGLVGRIEKIVSDEEVVVDLGNNVKVTALRNTIQTKDDPVLMPKKGEKAESEELKDKKKKKSL